uniref:serine/threonine-protein phosphatase 7 long form homolog n=1 Tax=Fragaria vesca subsp. vesca TaxID=101020 RepID=UPI0005C951F7|nr:PREDICTED: serine/threonine-protein phosphatase 7 long form homolog [Fragaria vesca subsp. vesca]
MKNYNLRSTDEHLNNLTSWLPNQTVSERLANTGFNIKYFEKLPSVINHCLPLLSALLERYDSRERCFIFNGIKCGFFLEDVYYCTGLPVDGVEVTGVVKSNNDEKEEICRMYLGVSGLLTKGKISLKNLRDRFINAEDTDYYTRAYLLYVIGSFIVPDKTGRSVDVMFLEQLKDIDKTGTFAWGAALLAHLHVELETASESSLAGHSYSLMIWAFLHIPKLLKLLPNTGRKGPDEFPLLVQWTNWLSLDLKNNFHKNLKSKFSDILDNLKDEDIVWQPYKNLQNLPNDHPQHRENFLCRTVLICYNEVVYHRPDLCPKQYGIDKPEYSGVRKEIAIYKKQRKLSGEIDWSKYTSEKGKVDYSKYIQEWKHRSESLLKEALGVEEHSGPTLSSTPSSIGNVRYDCSNTHFEDDEPEVEPLQPPPSEDATPRTQADASPKTPDDGHGSGGEEITWNTFYLAFSGQAHHSTG